jgi:Xaa-Pro aminopeptidase
MHAPVFTPDVYSVRRNVLKKKLGSGLILLLGNEESSMNYRDNWYPFRQDSSFLYYFGLDIANLAAIIDIDADQETIFGNDPSIDDIVWTGALPSLQEIASHADVQNVRPYQGIGSYIKSALASKRQVYWLPPYRHENKIKISEWLNISLTAVEKNASVALIQAIVNQRSYKSAAEVKEIENAVSVSADMHLAAMLAAEPGIKEHNLVAQVEAVARTANARTAYPTILTINGQTLHNHFYGNTLTEGKLVLCDAGAEISSHYCGDLTRTFPVAQKFSSKQKEIYSIVLDALETSSHALKPGVRFADIHTMSCVRIATGLKALGLMKGSPEEAVAEGAHALFFPCGVGHMIGLDVHDMEDLGEQYVGYSDTVTRSLQFGRKYLRLGRALEQNFVVTVEPGIYFIPELIDQWKAAKKFEAYINYNALDEYRSFGGVRIEDNLLITDTGSKLLGKHLPKTISEIESLR